MENVIEHPDDMSRSPRDTIKTKSGPLILTDLAHYPPETLLDKTAVAAALGSSPRTLRRMVDRGEIPPGTPVGGRKLWQVGQLRDFIRNRAAELQEESKRHSTRLRDYR